MLFKIYQTPPKVVSPSTSEPPSTSSPIIIWKNYLLFSFFGLIFIVAVYKGVEFLELTKDGKVVLSKERQEKLDEELADLEEGEQYVLIVTRKGTFPCFSCPNQSTIDLEIGNIYRYGTTFKGEKGRYGNSLNAMGLSYVPQFFGTIQECLMEEKRKIYYYALLPENLNRKVPLIRPPGNKQDR